jgi:hypothetical protein
VEYNLTRETKLIVGDMLKDAAGNKYVVVDLRYSNTHSQYASEVFVECISGNHKGRFMWVDHYLASEYKA